MLTFPVNEIGDATYASIDEYNHELLQKKIEKWGKNFPKKSSPIFRNTVDTILSAQYTSHFKAYYSRTMDKN